MPNSAPDDRDIYSVGRLNAEARALLEGAFPLIWVQGELSNVSRPSSGHLYFTLKDASAQIRCAMFRGNNRFLRFRPEDGAQVVVRANLSLYEARGDYQLIVQSMEAAGDGALQRTFEALKQKLAAEGLFDAAHKVDLPALPRRIGVITSPTGAAIRDILSVLARRFPAIPVLVYPVPVQGQGAGAEIAATIRRADARRDCDVLIVARGGGSLEDLWAFNEEIVARAIYDCGLPIVSGVGHEVDFTIADFVADRRAPTPSVAAEMVSPDRNEWLNQLRALDAELYKRLARRIERLGERLAWLGKRLQQQHPGQRLRQRAQRLDELEQRLHRATYSALHRRTARLATVHAQLQRHHPGARLQHLRDLHSALARRLNVAVQTQLKQLRQHLAAFARALDTVSPLATLERGYAIVTLSDGRVLHDAQHVRPGDSIEARLARGRLRCSVDAIEPPPGSRTDS
ncbi:MAG: exodeoxyribonuclease VII large subunit [Gammaproteobacteria bacterium]|nr:exodeoxyribonuclease VII large subunit [Gammaproteobacteria bacterium]